MLGYKPQELLSEVCFDFFHPDDLEHMVESYQQGLLLRLLFAFFFSLLTNVLLIQIQIHTRKPKLIKQILTKSGKRMVPFPTPEKFICGWPLLYGPRHVKRARTTYFVHF